MTSRRPLRARAFVYAAALAASTLAAALYVAPTARAGAAFEIERLRRDLYVVRGEGGNSLVRLGADGVLLVDAKTRSAGPALRERIDRLAAAADTTSDVRLLVLTHHHEENTGGRSAFPDAVVVTADGAAARLDGSTGVALAGFSTRTTLRLADGETVTCHHKAAGHTDGDVVVHFADARVLAVGGLVANGLHPAVLPEEGADVRSWIRVLRELRRDFGDDDDLIVVPGNGPTGGIEMLDRQIEYLQATVDLVEDAIRRGQTLDELLDRAQRLRDGHEGIGGDRRHFERTLRALYRAG